MKDLARSVSLGITIICCIGSGCLAGYLLDRASRTTPVFMILGLLAGTLFAFMALYKWAKGK